MFVRSDWWRSAVGLSGASHAIYRELLFTETSLFFSDRYPVFANEWTVRWHPNSFRKFLWLSALHLYVVGKRKLVGAFLYKIVRFLPFWSPVVIIFTVWLLRSLPLCSLLRDESNDRIKNDPSIITAYVPTVPNEKALRDFAWLPLKRSWPSITLSGPTGPNYSVFIQFLWPATR